MDEKNYLEQMLETLISRRRYDMNNFVKRALVQVTNSQQVIHFPYTHRVCTLCFCRMHGRWVRYVRPFVQDFFMQGSSCNGGMMD